MTILSTQKWSKFIGTGVLAATLFSFQRAQAATIAKNNTAGNLNTTAVWAGGVVPGSGDIAQWDSNDSSQSSASLGGSMTWLGIKVSNNVGAASYTISSTAGTTLTLATSGVDMSIANKDFTINSALRLGGAQTWSVGTSRTLTVGGSVSNGANSLITGGAGTLSVSGIIGNGTGGLTKGGTGVLTLSAVNTYTGPTTVNDGTFSLTTAGKISSSSPLVLGGGALTMAFNNDGSQTFNGTTVKPGASMVTSSGGNGGHPHSVVFGSIIRTNTGATADFTVSGSGSHSTTSTNVSSILGAFATFGGSDWASVSSGKLAAPSYTALPSSGSSATANYLLTGTGSLTANESVNTLKLNASSANQSLNLGTRTLTISGNGLLFIGNNAYNISNGTWTAGNSLGAYELIIQHYGAGVLTNTAAIQNNGANAVSLTFSGTGRLVLGATNTYSGGTVVNSGTLEARAASSLDSGDVRVHSGATLVLSTNNCMATTASLLLDGDAPSINLNYSGTLTQTIAALSFDGGSTFQSVGTWGSTTSTAANKDTRFTGSGILRVALPSATTIALTSGSNSATYGTALTFTATVTGSGTPTGNVTFKDGSTTIGTGTLNGSGQTTFSTNGFSVAGSPHLITAIYGGDTSFNGSTSTAATQTITAATLTVTPNAVSTVYSATTLNNASYSQNTNNYTITGFQNGQTAVSAGVTLSGSMAFNGSISTAVRNAGTYTQTVGTLALSSANNNYVMSFSNPTPNNYVISTAALTITAATNTKTYDGDSTAAATPTPSGLQGSDTVTGLAETYDDKNVNTGKTLSVSAYTVNDSNSGGNYSVTIVPNTTGVINTRALTISATGINKAYDATTDATVTLSDNRVSSDVLSTSYTSASFANKNVGTGKTISVSGINVTGTDAGNYIFNTTASTTANITAITVTGSITASNKVYDANNTANITGSSLSGVLSNDDVSISGPATFDNPNVGTGKVVTATGLSGTDAVNYLLSSSAAGTADITPATVTVTADDKTRAFGYPNPDFTASYSGFVSGEDTNVLSGTPDLSTTADTNTLMGTYPISITNGTLSAANYTFNFVDGTLTIGKAPLTVAADDQSRVYGETNPVLTVTYSGFVNGDSLTNAISGDPDISTSATTNSPVAGSPYDIVVTNGTLSVTNYYDLIFTNGTLTVTPAPVTGSITANNKIYNGNNTATIATRSLGGVLFDDDVTLSGGSATFDDQNVGTGKTVTATSFSLSGTDAGNYSLATNTITTTADITTATLTVTANSTSKTYGETVTFAGTEFTATALASGDSITSVTLTSSGAVSNAPAGDHSIVPSDALGSGLANYSITYSNGTLSVNQATLTGSITANNKVYDGTNTATIASRLLSGVLFGDDVSLSGGSATFDTANAGNSKTVTATGLSLGGSQAGNYVLASSSASTTADITAVTVTGSITASNKVYDANNTAPIATRSLSGTLAGDDVNLSGGSATFDTASAGNGKTVTATGLGLSGADSGNYVLASSSASTTADISPVALTVTADDKGRAFGYPNPAFTASYSGFVSGENTNVLSGVPDISTTADTNTLMGTYPISITNGTLSAANYTFSFVDGTLTIGKAPLTVAADNQSRAYGETNPVLTVTYTGFVNGDSVTNAISGDPDISTTATTNSPVAGSPYDIVVTNGTLSVTNYYDLIFTNGTLTVTPAPVTASVFVGDKVYDGTTTATIQSNDLATILFGDDVSLSGGSATFDTASAGNAKTVTVTGLALTGADVGNYSLATNTVTTTATITPGSLTVLADSTSKTYGETVTFAGTEFTATALASGDSITSVTLTSDGAVSNATAGIHGIVPSDALGSGLANYSISYSNGTLTVNQATVTGSITANNKFYDGNNTATITTRSLSGALAGDDVSLSGGSATFDTASAGNGKTVTATGLGLSGSQASNYVLASSSASTTADISPAALTVTADDKTRSFGYPNPAFTASYSGFVSGENTNVLAGTPDISTTADTNTLMGTYPITITNGTLSAANYSFNFVDGTLTIGKAPLTVAADDQSRVYGETNPVLTVTYSGFVNGDSVTNAISGDPDISTTATNNSSVAGSPYDIVVTNGTLTVTNYYDLIFTNGTLTVTPAPVTASVFVSDKVYDGTTTATIQSNDLATILFGDDVSLSGGSATFDTASAGNAKTVTVTGLALTGADAGNYSLATNTVTTSADIAQAMLTVTADNQTRGYGQANPMFTASYSGFTNGEVLATSDVTGEPSLTTTAVVTSGVAGSPYPIVAAMGSLSSVNYSFVFVDGSLTITQAASSVAVGSSLNPACAGALVHFTATVSSAVGTPSGTVQFKIDGVDLGTPVTLVAGSATSDDTGAMAPGNRTITAVYSGDSDFNGSTSPNYTQTINPVPAAPVAGNNGPVCEGSLLQLTASSVSNATYSWTGPNGFSSSEQNPSISNMTSAAVGAYNVTVTVNGCTSVAGSTSVSMSTAPTISSSPVSQTVNAGAPVTFSVGASGTSLNYQWRKGGVDISGATASSFNIVSAVGGDAANYDCVVSNLCGVVTSDPATLTVITMTPFEQWQMQYFGCTNCPEAAPSTDADGDNQNNLAEFLSGTDPTNSVSALRVVSIVRQGVDVLVTWSTAGGHTNALQVTTGGYNTNFVDLSSPIIIGGSGDASANYLDVGGATNSPSRFYRVRLVP